MEVTKRKIPRVIPDKGWAWIILLGAFFSNVCIGGVLYSFGIYFVELLEYFEQGRSATAWIGSVFSATYALVGPLASILATKLGCIRVVILGTFIVLIGFISCIFCNTIWTFVITYSIIGSLGLGIIYHCGFVMVSQCFEKHRPLCFGILSSGSSFGGFLFSPMSSFLISIYSWKGAILIVTGIVLNNIAVALIYTQHNNSEVEIRGGQQLFSLHVFQTPACSILYICTLLNLLGYFVPLTFLPDFAIQKGISKEKANLLLSIVGIGNTVSRALTGVIANTKWGNAVIMNNAALMIGGVITIICPWLSSYPALCVYSVVFGLSFGMSTAVVAIILTEFVGPLKLSQALGFLNACRGVSTLTGSPLAGAMFDSSGTYTTPFICAGIFIFLAGLVCVPIRKINEYFTKDDEKNDLYVESILNVQKTENKTSAN